MIVAGVFTPWTNLGLQVLHRLLLYSLMVVAPLLLGSNRPLYWGINGVVAAMAIAALARSEFARPESNRLDWHVPHIALLGMLVMGMWIAIQASPGTPQSLHHPIWFASPTLATAKGAISADPSQSWQALSWWSTLSIFIVAVRIGANGKQRTFLLELMLSMCVLVSVFGFLVEHYQLGTLGLFPKVYYQGWLTGTFVNRNSTASFFGIGLIIGLVLASREYRLRRGQSAAFTIFDGLELAGGRAGVYAAATLVLFTALLLTGSRAGIATAIIGSAAVMILPLLRRGRPSLWTMVAFAIALAISIGLAASAIHEREYIADSAGVRLSLYSEAVDAITDRPVLGHGAGAYSSIQPLYHRSSTPSDLIWDNAHSTVLEVIVTLGIPAAIFGVSILVFILVRLSQAWWNTTRNGSCLLVTIGTSLAVSLHSFVDFSLEIQANALYVACLVGLGMGEAMRLEAQSRQQSASTGDAQVERATGGKPVG